MDLETKQLIKERVKETLPETLKLGEIRKKRRRYVDRLNGAKKRGGGIPVSSKEK